MSQASVEQYMASSPPRPIKPCVSSPVYKGTGLAPLRSPVCGKKASYVGNLDPSKYRKLEGASDYTKAIRDGFKLLQLPFNSAYPSPDLLRKEFLDARSRKNAMAREFGEAQRRYEDWESALVQILGDKELRELSKGDDVVNVDDADTVMKQYLVAVTRIRLRDFCLSRKM